MPLTRGKGFSGAPWLMTSRSWLITFAQGGEMPLATEAGPGPFPELGRVPCARHSCPKAREGESEGVFTGRIALELGRASPRRRQAPSEGQAGRSRQGHGGHETGALPRPRPVRRTHRQVHAPQPGRGQQPGGGGDAGCRDTSCRSGRSTGTAAGLRPLPGARTVLGTTSRVRKSGPGPRQPGCDPPTGSPQPCGPVGEPLTFPSLGFLIWEMGAVTSIRGV